MGKRIKKIRKSIADFFKKITAPIRNSKVWKFLRRTILRSPFRGYFISSWRELRQVTWPSRRTAWKLTLTVFLFSALFAAFTSGLDYGFEKLAKEIFLK
ncbi:MAG: preprotein translocase subunit SecE [Candidatus Saccharimonadales bacterium]